MAGHRYKVDCLSVSSINNLIKELQKYTDGIADKCEEVVRRLAEIGLEEAEKNISKAGIKYTRTKNGGLIQSGSDVEHNSDIKINRYGNYSQAQLTVQGRDIMFIEFGAGVHYNGAVGTSPNPKGEEMGMTIGSYGYGQGKNDVWAYHAEQGELVITYGTKATMPMYRASLRIQKEAEKVIKEVFKR
jgi:hypothetical protein